MISTNMICRSAVYDACNPPKPPDSDSAPPDSSPAVPDATSPQPLRSKQPRCVYRFPSGPRCRNSVSPQHPQLCSAHLQHAASLPPPSHPEPPEAPAFDDVLAEEIAALAGDFSSPEQVNHVMGKIFHSLLHRRISAKEAGVLCYIAQTILHSHRALSYLQKTAAQTASAKHKVKFIMDLPGPLRD